MKKNMGRERISNKDEFIRCTKCGKRLYVSELTELGYIEKIGGKKCVTCMYCDEQFTK